MATTIFSEGFETDGNGTRYTTSVPEFTDGSGDFFTRTDGTDIGSFYSVTGATGSFFFAGMDLDGEGAGLPLTLSFEDIDVSGASDLQFAVDVAEDDDGTNEDWDVGDFVRIEYALDGGAFQPLLAFESISDGDSFNAVPALDTDFDGNGDGPILTDVFQTFTSAIPGTGALLDLQITFDLDSGDEDIALDNIVVSDGGGTPPAAPVVINEIVVSTAGTDREFVEFLGAPGTALDGLSLLEVEPGGEIDKVIDLDGNALGANGYFLAATPEAEAVLGVTGDLSISNNTFTNGSRTYLLVDGFSGASGDDIDGDDDGAIDNAPWAEIVDSVAPIENDNPLIYSSNVIGPDGSFLAPGGFRDPEETGAFQIHDFFDTAAYTPTAASQPEKVVINAVLGSTTGADSEYIELFGTPGASLDGLSLIVVESDDQPSKGDIDTRIDLEAGDVIGDNGFFLLANGNAETAFGVTANKTLPDNSIENSSYTLALVETSSLSGGAVTGDETVIDSVGATDGEGASFFAFGAPVVGPDGSFLPAGVRRNEDGVDTDLATDFSLLDFFNSPATNTPTAGAGDTVMPPAETAFIHEVQGSGDTSPLEGQTVTVEAIVVGDFQDGTGADGDLNGFFLQEEDADADGDAATSEGVFVFDGFSPSVDVAVGNRVEVTGTVTEFFGETQIAADSVSVLSSNNALPTAAQITFPVASTRTNSDGVLIADLEAYEGMRVDVPQELTVSDLFTLGRFGDIGLHADGRLEQFTQANAPDIAGFQAYQDLAVRNSITLDDGSTVQNPDTIPFEIPAEGGDIPGQFDAADDLNVGDTVTDLTGVLRFGRGSGGFGDEIYRVNPTDVVPFQNTNPRETTAPETGGSLTVASFNVLNFFTTLDDDDSRNDNPLTAGPNGSEPRGANDKNFDGAGLEPSDPGYVPDLTEFNRQLDKLMAAFAGMEADIYGLVEVENEIGDQNGDEAFGIGFLADELNARFGTNYQFADPGSDYVGSDAISVGFLYDADTVRIAPGTSVEVLDDSVLPSLGLSFGNPVFDGPGTSRAPIAATFEELATGETFTAANNHFKSKGSVSPFGNNAGIGDGAGNNNEARTQAAIALDAWLDTDPTGSGDEDVLILGDLNAYAMEDPLQTLFGEGYADAVEAFLEPGEFSYSFGFPISLDTSPQVQAFGSLDYVLANQSLFGQVTGAEKWHINADEASALDYNIEFKPASQIADLYAPTPFRSSDHDPVLVGLDLTTEPDVYTLEILHAADQEAGEDALISAPNFSAVLAALEAEDLGADGEADNTVKLSSGDAIIPGLFFEASAAAFGGAGRADILIQNELGFQAITLGNHEFDLGTPFLADLIAADIGYDGALFPYLSTNLDFSSDADLAPLEVAGGQAPQANTVTSSVVLDVNGENIGVIGATTPNLASISSPGGVTILPSEFPGQTFSDAELQALAAEIQAEVDLLTNDPDNPTNKIILQTHFQSLDNERGIIQYLSDVDVVIGGGSNSLLADENDPLHDDDDADDVDGEYPEFLTDADGNPVALVNTDGNYKYVGRLVLDFDENGHVIPTSYDAAVSGAYATDAAGVAALDAEGLIDPEIQAIVDALEVEIDTLKETVIGFTDVDLDGNRASVRTEETNMGNLTADANLAEAQKTDPEVLVSLKNGGGIRAPIDAGEITIADHLDVLRFNNDLVLVTLTGAQLAQVLEHAVAATGPSETPGQFAQVAGVNFSFDPDAAPGERVENAVVLDGDGNPLIELVVNGEVVAPEAEVRVVTLGFLAGGGDGYPYPEFEAADPAFFNKVALEDPQGIRTGEATFANDGTEQDALAEYLIDNHGTEATAFNEAETEPALDARIQNLNERNDDVFDFNGFVADDSRVQRFELTADADKLFVGAALEDGGRQRFLVEGFEAGVDQVDFTAEDILFSREAGPNLLVYIDNDDRDSFVFRGVDEVEDLFTDLPIA